MNSRKGGSDWGMLLVFVFVMALSFAMWAIYGHGNMHTRAAVAQPTPAPYPVNSAPPSTTTDQPATAPPTQ